MRWISLALLLAATVGAHAAGGRIYKVLPQYLDDKGRQSITPSLYDRDAYQAFLRHNPAKRTAVTFAVQWKATDAAAAHLKLRVEMRGVSHGDPAPTFTIEAPVEQAHWFSHWANLTLGGDKYKSLGEVTAWRATLWDGDTLLSEQKSFLW